MTTRAETLIDANIILRLLLGDIPLQVEKSKQIFKRIEKDQLTGIVSILVVGEILWVLENFYKRSRKTFIPQVIQTISLRSIRILEVGKQDAVQTLEEMLKTNLDFTDLYLIYFSRRMNTDISSFDKNLLKVLEN